MDIPTALLLLGVAAVMWRSALRLPAGILALVVVAALAGDHLTAVALQAVNADLRGGLSGDLLALGIIGVGFALACGWRPGRRSPKGF